MSHISASHVAYINASCHTCECVMSHIWMRHVTHANVSCHTYECVMSHIRINRVTHTNKSYHTYECFTSHTWTGRGALTHENASCHTFERVVSHMHKCHVTNVVPCIKKKKYSFFRFPLLPLLSPPPTPPTRLLPPSFFPLPYCLSISSEHAHAYIDSEAEIAKVLDVISVESADFQVCARTCVCVCVRGRDREREKKTWERERESVCRLRSRYCRSN